MTPAARFAAAINVLDVILAGKAAERALLSWSRGARYAGSKDRAAVRDHVFDVLRQLGCCAFWAGIPADALGPRLDDTWITGRDLIIGFLRSTNQDPDQVFTGGGYAPDPLSAEERDRAPLPVDALSDVPVWFRARWILGLGDEAQVAAQHLRARAPLHLRVNSAKGTLKDAQTALEDAGIMTVSSPVVQTALEVTHGGRHVKLSSAFTSGLVEVQDAGSQAVIDVLNIEPGQHVLDYCAGGGGKSLALAARGAHVTAHDALENRMRDLPERAARAGVSIPIMTEDHLGKTLQFDMVLCDVPCSGSGAWRRSPEGRWRLTSDEFEALITLQREIVSKALSYLKPDGVLAYATCSVFKDENDTQLDWFEDAFGLHVRARHRWTDLALSDGLFCATLNRK